MLESLLENKEIVSLVVLVAGTLLDALLGKLPDKYIPYIGIIRRILDRVKRK